VSPRSSTSIGGIPLWLLRTGILIALLASAYLIFELGRMRAQYSIVEQRDERQSFQRQIAALERAIILRDEDIVLLETHRDIDRAAYGDVETGLADLQRKILEQSDAIPFYRGIVSPADGGRGLRVQDFKLKRGEQELAFVVRLVLIQVMQHDRAVKGNVGLSIDGEQDGVATTYTLQQLVPPGEDSSWPFSFRYFQDFDRNVVLPAGFTPERINISVRSQTRSIVGIEESIVWQVSQG